ncbi:MAG: alpha/beta hydrolase [Saprospiraceae bacterium]
MLYLGIFLLLGGWAAAIFAAPYTIIIPPRGHKYAIPAFRLTAFYPLEIITFDAFKLKGYFRPADTLKTKGIIIFLHGIGGKKEHFMGSAEMLAREGFASVVYDARAHGESQGKYCTYGSKEKLDVQAIVQLMKEKMPDTKIGVWGNSLGGAVALQAMEITPDLSFGIILSTFADLRQIVFDYQKRILHGLGSRKRSDKALRKAGEIAGFIPEQIRPVLAATKIEQAILIAHGDKDKNISVAYAKSIFNALSSAQKELIIVPGAGHFDLFERGGASLNQRFIDFLNEHTQ